MQAGYSVRTVVELDEPVTKDERAKSATVLRCDLWKLSGTRCSLQRSGSVMAEERRSSEL